MSDMNLLPVALDVFEVLAEVKAASPGPAH